MQSGDYQVAYLPSALADLEEIARYVSQKLGTSTADRLSVRLIEGNNTLASLPYRRTVYVPLRPLAYEFRALKIDSYLVFYWIEDEASTVVIAAVIYGKADIAHRMAKRDQQEERNG